MGSGHFFFTAMELTVFTAPSSFACSADHPFLGAMWPDPRRRGREQTYAGKCQRYEARVTDAHIGQPGSTWVTLQFGIDDGEHPRRPKGIRYVPKDQKELTALIAAHQSKADVNIDFDGRTAKLVL